MLSGTIEELRAVALAADDASGHFPAMYARVTERVQRAASSGRFGDDDGMVRFARAFADRYLHPRAGAAAVPGCWQAAWDVADDPTLLIVQHLLLGINAHVNHDLALVVVQLADESGDLAGMRQDFGAINTLLAETMPDVLHDLNRVSRWVNLAAARGGGRFFNFSLATARAQAWRAAERLHRLDAHARGADAADLDHLVRVLGHLVATPGRPVRWLVPLGRRLETRDSRQVTTSLLGHLA
ncbi:DUF5995 family protein [soil metagenome]